METAPGGVPEESVEERQPLREAVARCVGHLDDKDRFVLDAIHSERLSYAELADRMAVSKTWAFYLTEQAEQRLRALLLTEPLIRRRLNLMIYWNGASLAELHYIAEDLPEVDHEVVESLNELKARAFQLVREQTDAFAAEPKTVAVLVEMARIAMRHLIEIDAWDIGEFHKLLCSKQADYGHNNILDGGMVGLVLRTSDKVARITTIEGRGGVAAVAGEPLSDAYADIVGYAAIARMLLNNTFLTELEPF
jgi:hypothetical protein